MDLKMILEAILFGSPEPMPLEKLAKIVNEPVEKVEANLKELKKELEDLKAKNGEKDKTLENLQKQIDKNMKYV